MSQVGLKVKWKEYLSQSEASEKLYVVAAVGRYGILSSLVGNWNYGPPHIKGDFLVQVKGVTDKLHRK